MKRIFSVLLAVALLLSMGASSAGATDALTVSIEEVGSVTKLAGSIDATFGKEILPESLTDRVILKTGLAEVPISTVVTENVLTISYGELEENQTYTLTLKAGIEAADGSALESDATVTFTTDQSAYRVKSEAPYTPNYAEHSSPKLLDSGIYVATGQVRYRPEHSAAYDNKAEMALWQPNTMITDKYSYLVDNGLTDTITTDFAIEFSFEDLGTAGTGGRYFTIAPDKFAKEPNGNNNTFTIMPKTTEARTQIQLTESTATNPMIQLAEGTNTTLNLQKNTRGLYEVKMVSCMGGDGNFDMEMSSGTASAMVDFDKYESFGSFAAFNDGKATYAENATFYGSFNIYRITPLGVLDSGKNGSRYKIIMNDDIAEFPETGIFVESNYKAATRTFTIPMSEMESVSMPISLEGLKTDDGAFSTGKVTLDLNKTIVVNNNLGFGASVNVENHIKKNKHTFSVEFDNVIDEASIDGNVYLKKQGTSNEIAVTASKSESNEKEIVVVFPTLEENSTYILGFRGNDTMDKDRCICALDADTDYWLHKNLEIKLITDIYIYQEYLEEKQILDKTYSEMEDGPYTDADTNMYLQSTFETTKPSTKDLTVKTATKDSKTLKYLQMGIDGSIVRDSYYGYTFPTPVTEEDVVLDLIFKLEGPTPQSRGIRVESNIVHNLMSAPSAQKDEFGYYHLRYLFERGTDGKYDVKVYDALKSLNTTIATTDANLASLKNITCQQYGGAAYLNKGTYFNIAQFKLTKVLSPKVDADNSNLDNISRSADEIVAKLSIPAKSESVTEDLFGITRTSDGAKIKTELVSYDEETATVRLKLKEYLTSGEEYKLSFTGLESVLGDKATVNNSYSFTAGGTGIKTEGVVFKKGSEVITELETGTGDFSATASIASEEGNTENSVRVFLILYDDTGLIVSIAEQAGTASATASPVTATLSGQTIKQGYKLKCYVWQNTSAEQRVSLFNVAEIATDADI
ncbi:MAG: Ig-like domain-containing protein [Clostridia bacterium]|nr:Ig-like domain-containing protein [Clostridia bacterium]